MDIDEFLESEKDKMEHTTSSSTIITSEEKEQNKQQSMEDLIDNIRLLLQKNDFKKAGYMYLLLKEQYSEMTKHQLEEKHFIHDELEDINKKLIASMEAQLQGMKQQEENIMNMLRNAEMYLNKKQVSEAEKLYKEIKQLFGSLPHIFDERKFRLENAILNFYSRLTVALTSQKIHNFDDIKNKLEQASQQAIDLINRNEIKRAKQLYYEMNKMFSSLPDGFMYEKILLYRKILEVYKETELKFEIGMLSKELRNAESNLSMYDVPKPSNSSSKSLNSSKNLDNMDLNKENNVGTTTNDNNNTKYMKSNVNNKSKNNMKNSTRINSQLRGEIPPPPVPSK